MNPKRHQRENRPIVGKDFGRRAVSRSCRELRPFTVCGISQAGLNVLDSQVGEILQDLLLCHSGGEVLEYVVYGYAHPSNAGLTAAFPRFNGDDVSIIHGGASGRFAARRIIRSVARIQDSLSGRRDSGVAGPQGKHLRADRVIE